MTIRPGFWRREHHLDRMTLRELVVAYFQYPAILVYLALAAAAAGLYAARPAPLVPTLAAIAAASLVYPLVWYLLHRWVLHSKWMWKSRLLAPTWKRIHYDHHQDPNHLEVLFGALHTTLPTIALGVVPLGWAIGAPWGRDAAVGAALARPHPFGRRERGGAHEGARRVAPPAEFPQHARAELPARARH